MKYNVNNLTNFCRIFELPEKFPSNFCWDRGIDTNFKMVDWFNPIDLFSDPIKVVDHDDLYNSLVTFVKKKPYVKKGRSYLIITAFGASFTFGKA